ncbi:hypothetical protein BSKO_01081 [Bryopsis sp. KO-2023]|nr:hypothetical protein BSKO_01081 [Bryopsis sp. KO-2023]
MRGPATCGSGRCVVPGLQGPRQGRCRVSTTRSILNDRRHRGRYPLTCAAAASAPGGQMLVYVPPHPLVKHFLAVARNETTPPSLFRAAISELGRVLIYEAGREFLPTVDSTVIGPLGEAQGTIVDPSRPVKVIPILRGGLCLQDQIATVLPNAVTYHMGLVRNPNTLEPSIYLNTLPASFAEDDLLMILDPTLATGGTMMRVLQEVTSRGAKPENIRIISVIAAPPALQKLSARYPGMAVYAAIIDPELNERGFIVPGYGDAGDRAFGTF